MNYKYLKIQESNSVTHVNCYYYAIISFSSCVYIYIYIYLYIKYVGRIFS